MRKKLALLAGKIILKASKILQRGGGSAAPGLYSLQIDPNLVSKLAGQIPQNIVITGTNGKTTTSRILTQLLTAQGLSVMSNSTGSNLERGIASTLIGQASLSGKIQKDIGIWELDEAAFNNVIFSLKPQIIVFLNVFRDQLDRYGEVDTIVKKWKETLFKIGWEPLVLINGNDGHLVPLVDETEHAESFFVQNYGLKWEKVVKKSDSKKLITAKIVKNLGLKGSRIKVFLGQAILNFDLPMPGLYHIYDFLAALSVYYSLNLPLQNVNKIIQDYSPAFGRVEKLRLGKGEGYIFLIKNPAGATAVFETIASELKKGDRLLIALNDNFADGTDVSWIWDAEFEKLAAAPRPTRSRSDARDLVGPKLICSGKRADDLAVRLKYAGIDTSQIEVIPDLKDAFTKSQKNLKNSRVFILPTYTALLSLQNILAQAGLKKAYWKESV
ncbi:hypothetical protein A2631_00285 [Candidatus Daviesbacteria bacterium RIFCSPHIGHO2_01_FULL_44_29]|uniref:Lipid II isoglutaminyl synthase (glutamine-hydrolyzing) subunit MurT n=1 Tax=Candidatus Daviesbacteria bacterium RIFCSPHIGHO2_02_FULL_43_12 TaxID=1797776 RepID=A0A1F5KG65_9BACT|nr:MAG: hypothetical protein A2631_00285 [Candidatus Daviesbacteria bacterium RIFCSPHIGHO2_01_FULL_44_29]OGE38876.1 MAG: hypothetical protein A3E86_03115 [Candidatus Daviesbacteria bacterium RIFCSPHIGHO2_12_FULL_47_45]OGE39775.1 MAG: hypothetical protein A3D25_03555 [Candidatus Daviesbacteria bacterium RIFCSPHIGHO2_02_FULL_43_12]OGE69934.1 MAG: hypothetical protein A3B55_04530 [Candidatus Daviesbacteria bacterium RIFCSPLOWO2_01_FULL_43_15]